MNLVDYIKKESVHPSAIAIHELDTSTTLRYEELWERVDSFSAKLMRHNVQSGDVIMLALPNGIDWVVSFLAAINIGAIVAPLKLSATSSEIKHLINQCKPYIFIGDSSLINRSLPFDLVHDKDSVVVLCKPAIRRMRSPGRFYDIKDYYTKIQIKGDSPAVVCFTYRGLGYPLGAIHSHRNFIEGSKGYIKTAGFKKKHRFLSNLPFSYIYPLLGCLMVPLITSSTIYTSKTFSPDKILDFIKNNQIDVLTSVPEFYRLLLSSKNSDESMKSIKFAFSGSSPLGTDLYALFQKKYKISIRQGYGLTETLPITCNPKSDNRPDSVGKPLLGINSLKIKIDTNNSPVGGAATSESVGEVCISSPTLMLDYVKSGPGAKEVIKNGWFYTGDLGWFDKNGYLHLVGLIKRIIKVGGNMVDLKEVESRILKIPCIKSAFVYAVPDERWGSVVAADIRTDKDNVEVRYIRDQLKEYLSSYKIPKIVRVLT